MPNYAVIARAGAGKIGVVGATEAACIDIGSIRKVEPKPDFDVSMATLSNANDAAVDGVQKAYKFTVSLELEEAQKSAIEMALAGTSDVNGNMVDNSGQTVPNYISGYFHGFKILGLPKILHVVKAIAKPGGTYPIDNSGNQVIFNVDLECMVYVDSTFTNAGTPYKMWAYLADSTDTVAPTIASTVPAANATAIAVGASMNWTFSEAIQSALVTARHFGLVKDTDGSVVAGALSVSGDNKTVTFTPTANLTAATAYRPVVMPGVKDVSGNELAAMDVRKFTTA